MLKQGSYFYYCSRIITRQFSSQQGLDLGQRMLTGWPGLRARGCWGLRGQGAWALGSTCWHSHSLPLWLCFLCAMRPASPALPVLSCAMMTSDLMHGHSFSFRRKGVSCSHPFFKLRHSAPRTSDMTLSPHSRPRNANMLPPPKPLPTKPRF